MNYFNRRIGDCGGEESCDPVDGAVVDARVDRGRALGASDRVAISREAVNGKHPTGRAGGVVQTGYMGNRIDRRHG